MGNELTTSAERGSLVNLIADLARDPAVDVEADIKEKWENNHERN